jgi:hypothetical protein
MLTNSGDLIRDSYNCNFLMSQVSYSLTPSWYSFRKIARQIHENNSGDFQKQGEDGDETKQ